MSAAGGSPGSRRARDGDTERLPLFGSGASGSSSPMGTLKHRTGGSLGDVLVAGAAADDAKAHGGAAPSVAPAVLLCVAVASMGALCFGYHLGVVNGPLEALSQELGFGGSAFLQGLVGAARRRLRASGLCATGGCACSSCSSSCPPACLPGSS